MALTVLLYFQGIVPALWQQCVVNDKPMVHLYQQELMEYVCWLMPVELVPQFLLQNNGI